MSSRREVLIRIALLQRMMLSETKNRTLKCLKCNYSTVWSMKNVAVLTEDPGAFDSSRVPTTGNSPSKVKKKANVRGSARGRGGGWGGLGAAGID